MVKLRRHRVTKSESDREYILENNIEHHDYSKIRRILWRLAKGTWKAFKVGFETTVASQPFCIALEPIAVATTIAGYRARKKERR